MALELFMRLDGVEGGSRNYHHQGWADILSWTWGMSRERVRDGDAVRDVTRLNEIVLEKAIGVESPTLMTLCANGARIKDGEISVVPVVGKREAQKKYVIFTFENLIIRSISTGADAEETFLREKVAIRFGRMKYEYFEPRRTSAPGEETETDVHAFGWDLSTGATPS